MEKEKFKCQGCGAQITRQFKEFVDVTVEPQCKGQILNGQFFLTKCPRCGEATLTEYPVMYTDPSRKLTVYLAPEHDDALLAQLNSLELPEEEADPEAVFRVVNSSSDLLEKILIFDGGRDDRLIELYKALIYENLKEEFPKIKREDLLYFRNESGDFFIVWDYINAKGEQLTVNLDDTLYGQLRDQYLQFLEVPAGKYAEVDRAWLDQRVDVE